MTISKSPDRYTFQAKLYEEQLEAKPNDEYAKRMLEWLNSVRNSAANNECNDTWKEHNLEYDLRSTDWILEKVRTDEAYAQNLYAALCNNSFIKNDVWPVLQDKKWGCSWRYAGGIIADMRQEGDYIDWYCSGIGTEVSDEEYAEFTPEQKNRYEIVKSYVSESTVTDEIKNDLLRLGWLVVEE